MDEIVRRLESAVDKLERMTATGKQQHNSNATPAAMTNGGGGNGENIRVMW